MVFRYSPIRANKIRTNRAKTVPPGPAIGPNMVLAAKKTDKVVRERVSRLPRCPLGGQNSRQNLVAQRPWKQADKPQEVWWSEEPGQGSGGTAGS